ncbi:uncharacterized protein LOC120517378 [Polypterus senegalus]|uniref:uncharacterized protein LOC120517378 n=1 Tax=Polypterus senegalus TaxID=55291 RepID=UPI0019657005|nr:uncharacterized protein LOC120517378 [Polypterus senegalus]
MCVSKLRYLAKLHSEGFIKYDDGQTSKRPSDQSEDDLPELLFYCDRLLLPKCNDPMSFSVENQFNELLYSYNGYSSSPYFSRHCVTPDICNGSGSVNYGDESWTKLVECCTSDMCNNEGGVIPSEPNGLVCCFGSNGHCKMFVPCKGIEDHCFTSENGFLGCASSSVCKNPGIANKILKISSPSQISCCQGYLCNKPPSVLLCHNCQITSPWESCENKSDSIVPCDSLSSMCSSGQDGNVTANTFGEPNGLVCCGGNIAVCENLVYCTGIEEFCFTAGE